MRKIPPALLLLALLLSALPWEALAAVSKVAAVSGAAVTAPESSGAQSAAEDCCVCLCFSTSGSVLPALAKVSGSFELLSQRKIAVPGRENSAPQAPPRLVFHPPRLA